MNSNYNCNEDMYKCYGYNSSEQMALNPEEDGTELRNFDVWR